MRAVAKDFHSTWVTASFVSSMVHLEIYTDRQSARYDGTCPSNEEKKYWRKKNNSGGITLEKLDALDAIDTSKRYGFARVNQRGTEEIAMDMQAPLRIIHTPIFMTSTTSALNFYINLE